MAYMDIAYISNYVIFIKYLNM